MFRRPKRQRETVDLQFDNGTLSHLNHGGESHAVADNATVAQNTTDIAAAESDISTLQTTVNTNTTDIATNQSDLTSLQTTVNSNTNTIATNQSNISSLQTTVTSNTTAIDDKITSIQESGGTMTGMTIDGTTYTLGGGASTLNELTDVSVGTPSDGQALVYSSNQWVPGTGGTAVVANPSTTPTTDLTKVTIGSTDYRIPSLRTNYAYREITANDTTQFSTSNVFETINGFGDTSITTSSSNSKIRVNMILKGDANFNPISSRIQFERVVDGTTTIINAPTVSGRQATLSSTAVPYIENDTSMATWKVLFVDELSGVGSGKVITYRPKMNSDIQGGPSHLFYLNMTKDSGATTHENTISFIELQEIDAAPQLSNVSTTGAQAGQALVYNSSNQWVPSRTLLPFGWQVTLYGWTASYTTTGGSGPPYYFTFPMPTTSGTSDVASTTTLWGINKYGNYMDTNATYDEMLLEANTRYFLTFSFNINTTTQRRYHRIELWSSSTQNGTKTLLKRPCSGGADRSSSTMYQNLAQSFTFETGDKPYIQLRTVSEHRTNTYHGNSGEPNKNEINIFKV